MKEKVLIIALLSTAAVVRIYQIINFSVPFPADMGRDLLWAKDISYYHIPTLIGPLGSIWGVYFGPLWFYFLSVPLLVSGGNPLSAVYATCAVILICGLLSYLLFKKYLKSASSLILATLILFNANLISISTFAFHANVLPLLSLLMVYFCFLAVVKNPLYLSFSFLAISLMFHADPAPAVVFTFVPIAVFFTFKLYKSKIWVKTLLLSAISYTVPFLPQIVFELRNSFVQTRSLAAYFMGNNPSLSGQLPLLERITNRISVYFNFTKSGFAGDSTWVLGIFAVIVLVGLYKFHKSEKDAKLIALFKILFLSFILTFLIFTFVVTVELKTWYLYGTSTLIAFIIFFGILGFRNKVLTVTLTILFVFVNLLNFFSTSAGIGTKKDPALLSNQLEAINTIYENLKNESYSVYVFTPSIYDYNYQYLYWWQGEVNGKGLPAEFAYLPNKPEYIRNKTIYTIDQKQANTIFLIIERSNENQFYTQADWLKNFDNYVLVWEKDINGAITLQKRAK